MTRRVNGAVDHVTGVVDAQSGRVIDNRAVDIDLDQVGRRDFIEQQAEGVDQKVLVRPRHPSREMRVDVIGPALERRQTIRRRQLDPDFPFLWRNPVAHTAAT